MSGILYCQSQGCQIFSGKCLDVLRLNWQKVSVDFSGIRVSMETKFDGVITPLKIDISTGDVITPKERRELIEKGRIFQPRII